MIPTGEFAARCATTPMLEPLRAAIYSVLTHAHDYTWTVQGLGMMRTYIGEDEKYRVNVWSTDLITPQVSTIHSHPWDLRSWVMAGIFHNTRFKEVADSPNRDGERYDWIEVRCGEDGGKTGVEGRVKLIAQNPEKYLPGQTYTQKAEEIHKSGFTNGAVTLNERHPRTDGLARVFMPMLSPWGDAKPRVATPDEVAAVAQLALDNWNYGIEHTQ